MALGGWSRLGPYRLVFFLIASAASTAVSLQVNGATWAYSLLLSGSLLARFAPALCFNFLHVIRMNEYLGNGEVRLLPGGPRALTLGDGEGGELGAQQTVGGGWGGEGGTQGKEAAAGRRPNTEAP